MDWVSSWLLLFWTSRLHSGFFLFLFFTVLIQEQSQVEGDQVQKSYQAFLSGHFGDWGKPEGGLPPEGDNPNPENPGGFVLLFGTRSPANYRMERFHFQRKLTNQNADHRSGTVLGNQNTTVHSGVLILVGKTFSPQEAGRGQGELYFL